MVLLMGFYEDTDTSRRAEFLERVRRKYALATDRGDQNAAFQ